MHWQNGTEQKYDESKVVWNEMKEKRNTHTSKKNEFDSFSGHLLFFMHPEMFANLSEKWIAQINE